MGDRYVKVARVSEVGEGRSKKVKIGAEEIALWRVNGNFYAINNVCAHQHFSALHEGTLDGLKVSCPMHGWTYSLETGVAESGSGRVKTYRVGIDGDDVFLEIPDGDS
jgi:nitrite reductase/ring-hydroxylating ferredoxin subunit